MSKNDVQKKYFLSDETNQKILKYQELHPEFILSGYIRGVVEKLVENEFNPMLTHIDEIAKSYDSELIKKLSDVEITNGANAMYEAIKIMSESIEHIVNAINSVNTDSLMKIIDQFKGTEPIFKAGDE